MKKIIIVNSREKRQNNKFRFLDLLDVFLFSFLSKNWLKHSAVDLNSTFTNKKFNVSKFLTVSLLLFCSVVMYSQTTSVLSNLSATGNDFKQFANDPQEKWINSILQDNNSSYFEGTSTLQRFVVVGVPETIGDQHVLILSHLATKGGHHAYDFIIGYDQALIDYQAISNTSGFTGLSISGSAIGPPVTAEMIDDLYGGPAANKIVAGVPPSGDYGSTLAQSVADRVAAYDIAVGGAAKRGMQLYGDAPITSAVLVFTGYANDDGISGEAYAHYELRWTSSSSNVMFLFGGHLSMGNGFPGYGGVNYGPGLGAASINGGPYHFKLSTLDGASLGSQDNQIKAGDIIIPAPPCDISPSVRGICVGGTAEFCGPTGLDNYTWSISPLGPTLTPSGNCVTVSGAGAGTYTLSLVTAYSGGITSTANCTATLNVNGLPVVNAPDKTVCVGSTTVQLSATPPGGTWSGDHVSASGLFDATGLAAANYTVTYTYTNGSNCTGSDNATVTVAPLPVISCPSNSMDNLVQCGVSATAAQTATNASFATWFSGFTGPGSGVSTQIDYVYTPASAEPISGHAPLNPILGVPGFTETSVTVTWTVTNTETQCQSSCSGTFALAYNCAIGCRSEVTPVLCYGNSTGSITVFADGGTPPYTVNLYKLPELVIPYATQSGLNTSSISVLFDNLPAGQYNYLVTDATNVSECNNNEPIIIVQPDAALSLSLSSLPENCAGTATGSITAEFSGGTPPYTIYINGGGAVVGAVSPYTFPNLSTVASYTIQVVDNNNCDISRDINVDLTPCDVPHCSLTQGFYGNVGGLACGLTALQIMQAALPNGGAGTYYDFGVSPNYFRLTSRDIASMDIFTMMPGGGTPRALSGYDTYFGGVNWSSDNNPLNKAGKNRGRINNVLLSQTITLFFNRSYDSTLGAFELSGVFTTADVACHSNVVIPDTNQQFTIPQSVIDYLTSHGGATVNNLFVLANNALGGLPGLPSHSDVNAAVDAVNRGFDQCRIGVVPGPAVSDSLDPSFTVYPIPFSDVINIKYQFDYISNVKVQIFDSTGFLLQSVDDNNAYINKEISITPRFNIGENKMFFIKVITDKGEMTQKIISTK